MYILIKDGKIYDICSNLKHKRDNNNKDDDYLVLEMGDFFVGDTWDNERMTSLKDSPQRFIVPEKTELELKIEDLEARIIELESRG